MDSRQSHFTRKAVCPIMLCGLSLDAFRPDNNFKQKLKTLLSEYSLVDVTAMGFPKMWSKEPIWK